MTNFDADFDKQKLMFHPREVAHWLDSGRTTGPIYTELELTRRCNSRCIFCGVDYQVNRSGKEMSLALAQKVIAGLAAIGNKSVMICGHGEPLLNPEVVAIVQYAAERMSVSMTCNGIALDDTRLPLIDRLEWLRFSVNGGTSEAYQAVHNVNATTFRQVLGHIKAAVKRKRQRGLAVTIGVQLVLLPENVASVLALAHEVKEIGVDYFSVKPYSQHPLSLNRHQPDYQRYAGLQEELVRLATPEFKVIYRAVAMERLGQAKAYARCCGTGFIAFVSANGDLWECNVFAGDPRFYLGNAGEAEIASLWNGPRRQQVLNFIDNELDLAECRDLCRMDSCNRYLWRLKNPWPHDNFI